MKTNQIAKMAFLLITLFTIAACSSTSEEAVSTETAGGESGIDATTRRTQELAAEAAARARVEALTESAEEGRIYTGRVVRVVNFGAFVEILPGKDGLVHISQLDTQRIESVESVAQVGDEITVMVTQVSPDGKIRLSRKAVLEGWSLEEAKANDQPRGGGRR